jgi:hypothetical protein
MFQDTGNLDDLAEVRTGCSPTGSEMEVSVRLKLFFDKGLHSLEIFFVKSFTDKVEYDKALLMRDRAELVGAHHVK